MIWVISILVLVYAAVVIGIISYISWCKDINIPSGYVVIIPAIMIYVLVKTAIELKKISVLKLFAQFNTQCIVSAQIFSYVLESSKKPTPRRVIEEGAERVEDAVATAAMAAA